MHIIILLLTTLLFHTGFAQQPIEPQEVDDFITRMVDEYGFERDQLTSQLNNIKMPTDVVERLDALSERLQQPQTDQPRHVANRPLHNYREIAITPERISGGINFWHAHKSTLDRMQEQFGIPAEVVLAIISNETNYGGFIGKHNALEALYTQAFYHPSRRAFFTREFAEFLLLAREQEWDTSTLLSSFDGGLGLAQFMPSSYRAYAIDFNDDGKTNLYAPEDAIGSIANYLTIHGWEYDGPVIVPATITEANLEEIEPLLIGPTHPNTRLDKLSEYKTLAEFEQLKVYPNYNDVDIEPIDSNQPAILIKMEIEPEEYGYWLAFNNFSVITTYNTRREYAKTIHELSEHIQQRFITDAPSQLLSSIHPKLPGLISDITAQYNLDITTVSRLYSDITVDNNLLEQYQYRKNKHPSWTTYRLQQINLAKIFNGAQYWKQHQDVFARASANYSIPSGVIAAFIGIVSDYEKRDYPYNALQVLTTLALSEHNAQEKYINELGQFLSLAEKEDFEANSISSSIDGRIGILAWLPSTYEQYAIDFSGNGRRDIINNSIDAIGSATNYIQELGWQKNAPIAVPAEIEGDDYYTIVNETRQPNRSIADLKDYGIIPEVAIEDNPLSMLIGVQDDLVTDYWLGFHNYYVLSRINREPEFILAINQLSKAITDEYQRLQLLNNN